MPIYRYKALSRDGTPVVGEVASASVEGLEHELSEKGLLVRSIREKRSPALAFLPIHRITLEDLYLFFQEFLSLLRAGLPIPESLAVVSQRQGQPELEKILSRVLDDVRRGKDLSDAAQAHPAAFDTLAVAALRAGEKTGDLVPVIQHYQEHLRRKIEFKKKIAQALIYPLFLLIALGVVLALMFTVVMPRFISIYADLGAELPTPTRVLIELTRSAPSVLSVILILLLATALLPERIRERIRSKGDGFLRHAPWIGRLHALAQVVQMARTIALLLNSGVPLTAAMRVTADALKDRHYKECLNRATCDVRQGASLSHALREYRVFPPAALKLIEVGEVSAELGRVLSEIGELHDQKLGYELARVASLVEPIVMLLVGLVLGTIIVVMYLPIFQLSEIVR